MNELRGTTEQKERFAEWHNVDALAERTAVEFLCSSKRIAEALEDATNEQIAELADLDLRTLSAPGDAELMLVTKERRDLITEIVKAYARADAEAEMNDPRLGLDGYTPEFAE